MTRPRPMSVLLLTLTLTTGLIDAVSIMGLGHVFTALMTGNVVFVGLALTGAEGMSAERSLAALGAFAVGAFLGGRLAARRKGGPMRVWFLPAAGVEAALVLAAAGTTIATGQHAPGAHAHDATLYGVIVLCSVAMGLRSATAVKISDPDLKTTVLTLTLTGIAADAPFVGGDAKRWARRIISVATLCTGALCGGVLLQTEGLAPPLVVSAGLVLAATVAFSLRPDGKRSLAASRDAQAVLTKPSTRRQPPPQRVRNTVTGLGRQGFARLVA